MSHVPSEFRLYQMQIKVMNQKIDQYFTRLKARNHSLNIEFLTDVRNLRTLVKALEDKLVDLEIHSLKTE